jgi:hypothetical protein
MFYVLSLQLTAKLIQFTDIKYTASSWLVPTSHERWRRSWPLATSFVRSVYFMFTSFK